MVGVIVADIIHDAHLRAATVTVLGLMLALVTSVGFRGLLVASKDTPKTVGPLLIIKYLHTPVVLSIGLSALWHFIAHWKLGPPIPYFFQGFLSTFAIVVWTAQGIRFLRTALDILSIKKDSSPLIQPRTVPLFDVSGRITLTVIATYFAFVAWQIDLTAWLTSAGIIGIALGFAAKETLANLFAGLFILADSPYKIGDYLQLNSNERGRVIDIGIRTTRLVTKDDVEVIVPNAIMGNSKVINLSGGPNTAERLTVPISVAYGSSIEKVRKNLLKIAHNTGQIAGSPPPQVHVTGFLDSGIQFKLYVWVRSSGEKESVNDILHTAIYAKFQQQNIEIPYPRQEITMLNKDSLPPDGNQ